MFNPTESDERAQVKRVKGMIRAALDQSSDNLHSNYEDVIALKQYLQDSKADMDHVEKVSVRQSIEQLAMVGDHRMTRNRQLARLLQSPYFGRIDFLAAEQTDARPVYVGIHSFQDAHTGFQWVHDWRAPVSGMFYDLEIGPAYYDAPEGRTQGDLTLKRQFRIERGQLVFMLDTSLNIHDDLLQQELSRASGEKMQNIVATIQRDQNAIIRNDHAHALIIQGAAGSGKTSVALHRIAYLLYKFKDSIRSEDVLILSPHRVFGHYISHVLPELGEEAINEITMETLADHLLDHQLSFQTFHEQVATLLQANSKKFAERIAFKSSPEFLLKLEEYAHYVKTHNLSPSDISMGAHTISARVIEGLFHKNSNRLYALQIKDVTEALVAYARAQFGVEISGSARSRLRTQLKQMFWCTDIKKLYKNFHEWMGEPGLFKLGKGKVYEYADVYPLIYLGMLLEGVNTHDHIKHLVIDEMQDYTPVQYRVLNRLFPCKKTVLGDRNQAVNPFGYSTAETIRDALSGAECMHMRKSYRSTLPILKVAQHIHTNPDLIPMERPGAEPQVITCASESDEVDVLRDLIRAFYDSDHKSLGLLCKTQEQADALYEQLRACGDSIYLLNPKSTLFNNGITVVTAHLSKGLEYDHVVVPYCTKANYSRPIDQHLLYVACTRAMHNLHLTHTGPLTPFLKNAPAQYTTYPSHK